MEQPPLARVAFDAPLTHTKSLSEQWSEAEEFAHPLPVESPVPRLLNVEDLRIHREEATILRTIPWGMIHSTYHDTADVLKEASRHTQLLRSAGISVVSHSFEVIERKPPVAIENIDEAWFTPNSSIAYGAAHAALDSITLPDAYARNLVDRQKIIRLVAAPLARYALHAGKHEREMLTDIYNAQQYSYDLNTRVVFLHDIDPTFIELGNDDDRDAPAAMARHAILTLYQSLEK